MPTCEIERSGLSLGPHTCSVPKRKQLIAMQKSAIGGTAVFIAEQNGHDEAVAMLIKHCKGEAIPMPAVRDRSGALAPGTDV